MKVGFIGLGAMGLPMAKRLAGAGHEVFTMVHVRREPGDEMVALGAHLLSTPAEIARSSEIVITIVPADRELHDTVFGSDGLLHGFTRGQVLIDMTTATPGIMRDVEQAVRGVGGAVLDAPVSGGTRAAEQGTLTIMVGGDAELLTRCRPLLAAMGTEIHHVGAVGQGKVVKMVNQVLAASHLLILGEAFALGMRCGADPRVLYEVVQKSSGYSRMMDLRLPGFLLEGRFEPGFRLDLMKKDVNLALDAGRAANVPLLLTSVVAQVFGAASVAGRGDADFAAAAQYLADLAGVRLSEQPRSQRTG